ncbi:pyrroline-5-carboxylate reductase dimerization domain-containing protein [Ruegeria sp.]|uniref:pyrroline-5-carboxylate reductase dimerization domain-containing protein n=1 Tax=Ruegeria sp. TaxID=1879320 RepID=UPI003AFFD727
MFCDTALSPANLRNEVTSPNGTTEAGLQELMSLEQRMFTPRTEMPCTSNRSTGRLSLRTSASIRAMHSQRRSGIKGRAETF